MSKSLRMGLGVLVEWEMKCESTFSIFPNVRKIFFSSFTHLLGIAGDDYENILERQKMDIGNFYIYHWKFARKVQSGREKKIYLKCQLSFKMQERATTSAEAFGLLFIRLIFYRMRWQNEPVAYSKKFLRRNLLYQV